MSETVEMSKIVTTLIARYGGGTIVNRSMVAASQMQHLFMPDSLVPSIPLPRLGSQQFEHGKVVFR